MAESGKAEEEKIFECKICGLVEIYAYYGTDPAFTKPIKFSEPVYVMRDPFTPTDRSISTNYLLIGGDCCLCHRSVCCDQQTCSIFYGKRYCRLCSIDNRHKFPAEIQNDISKMAATDPSLIISMKNR